MAGSWFEPEAAIGSTPHPTKPGLVTVAGKRSIELPRGTLNSILKQAKLRS